MEPIICPKCNVVCDLKKDGFYFHLNCNIRILDSGKSFVIFIGDEYAINNYGCISDLIVCEVIFSFNKDLLRILCMECCICSSDLVYYSKAYFHKIEYDYAYFCKKCNYYILENEYIAYNKYWSNKTSIINFDNISSRVDESNIIYFESNSKNVWYYLYQFDQECLFEERLNFTIKFVDNIEFM